MRHCIRAVMVATLVFCYGMAPWIAVAQGSVDGGVYTSPTFGYQLQWSAPWFFFAESSEAGVDTLSLYDGQSEAHFLFAFAPGITLQDMLAGPGIELMPGVSDFGPMLDAQGTPVEGVNGDQEWAVYTGSQLLDDGSTIDFMEYINLRPLDGGVVLLMTGVTVSYFWDDASLQSWHDLASTILVPLPGPDPEPSATPTESTFSPLEPTAPAVATSPPTPVATLEQRPAPDMSPTATPEATLVPQPPGEGEPAPSFAAGPWRMSVRAVDLGETIDYLGLGFIDGRQWAVLYADVTNWSAAEAQLDTTTWQLATSTGPIAPDAAGTQSTASSLGLEPADGFSVTVPAGDSIRLALVYSIPASETALTLQIGDAQLPLENAVGTQLDVTDLANIARPPSVESGTVRTLPDDGSGVPKFVVDTGSGERPIQLAGVDFTPPSDCTPIAGAALEIKVDGISGPVWLEIDPAIPEQDTYYIWFEDESGNRVLLNQFLIANGLGFEGDVPEAARFGAWLEQSEEFARSNSTGIWQLCA